LVIRKSLSKCHSGLTPAFSGLTPAFFAHPYSSWERGLNENTNGLIRQYFTKGSSFENITDDAVEAVMHKLNHRPRKTLNFKTPHEVFFSEKERDAA